MGLRIIAGEWRGRVIDAPLSRDTRPTADRTRETLFSMLTSRMGGFTDRRVADICAGSGALGLEALSRGASAALFVERDAAALAVIRGNIAKLGCAARATVAPHDAGALPQQSAPFDLVMIDPPYAMADTGRILGLLSERGWVDANSWVALETGSSVTPDAPAMTVETVRKVGKAWLHLMQPR